MASCPYIDPVLHDLPPDLGASLQVCDTCRQPLVRCLHSDCLVWNPLLAEWCRNCGRPIQSSVAYGLSGSNSTVELVQGKHGLALPLDGVWPGLGTGLSGFEIRLMPGSGPYLFVSAFDPVNQITRLAIHLTGMDTLYPAPIVFPGRVVDVRAFRSDLFLVTSQSHLTLLRHTAQGIAMLHQHVLPTGAGQHEQLPILYRDAANQRHIAFTLLRTSPSRVRALVLTIPHHAGTGVVPGLAVGEPIGDVVRLGEPQLLYHQPVAFVEDARGQVRLLGFDANAPLRPVREAPLLAGIRLRTGNPLCRPTEDIVHAITADGALCRFSGQDLSQAKAVTQPSSWLRNYSLISGPGDSLLLYRSASPIIGCNPNSLELRGNPSSPLAILASSYGEPPLVLGNSWASLSGLHSSSVKACLPGFHEMQSRHAASTPVSLPSNAQPGLSVAGACLGWLRCTAQDAIELYVAVPLSLQGVKG
jgi:hypothetical protein